MKTRTQIIDSCQNPKFRNDVNTRDKETPKTCGKPPEEVVEKGRELSFTLFSIIIIATKLNEQFSALHLKLVSESLTSDRSNLQLFASFQPLPSSIKCSKALVQLATQCNMDKNIETRNVIWKDTTMVIK